MVPFGRCAHSHFQTLLKTPSTEEHVINLQICGGTIHGQMFFSFSGVGDSSGGPHGDSQAPATLAPGDSMPSSGLLGNCTHSHTKTQINLLKTLRCYGKGFTLLTATVIFITRPLHELFPLPAKLQVLFPDLRVFSLTLLLLVEASFK